MFVLETIPCGWKLQGSYRFTMNPMKCEDVYRTRLNVVVTPALMSNYTEITGEKSFQIRPGHFQMSRERTS